MIVFKLKGQTDDTNQKSFEDIMLDHISKRQEQADLMLKC
jgi:hypothetical protein